MLDWLRTGLGLRLALTIAVLAAFGLAAPPFAIAFGHGENTVQCLAKADVPDHGMHGEMAKKHHGDQGKLPGTHAPGCCGLYCLTALPLASGPVVEGLFIAPALTPPVEPALFGRAPDRLDRPPISSLSV